MAGLLEKEEETEQGEGPVEGTEDAKEEAVGPLAEEQEDEKEEAETESSVGASTFLGNNGDEEEEGRKFALCELCADEEREEEDESMAHLM